VASCHAVKAAEMPGLSLNAVAWLKAYSSFCNFWLVFTGKAEKDPAGAAPGREPAPVNNGNNAAK